MSALFKFILVYLSILLLNCTAQASGLQLFELTGSLAGTAGAGDAASADDASSSFINPAGLIRLQQPQLVVNAVGLKLDTTFIGQSKWFITKIPDLNSGEQSIHANGGTFNLIPSLYYAHPINSNLVFGFNVAGPFGLAVDYSTQGFQRYSVSYARLVTVDIAPSLGFKLTDKLALGMGIDAQRLAGEMQVTAGIPLENLTKSPSHFDSLISNTFSDTAYGWHAGLLYQFTPKTRLGLSYHSGFKHHATGTSTITGPLANMDETQSSRTSTQLKLGLKLPAYTTLSLYHELNPKLALLASATYTQWSCLQNVSIENIAAVDNSLIPQPSNHVAITIPEHFKDTWRFALGSDFKVNSQLSLRAGMGYDQSPIDPAYRNLLIPDSNRYILATGMTYSFNPKLSMALGWSHYFMQKAATDRTQTMGPGSMHVQGVSRNAGNVFGLQLNWNLNSL